MKFDFPQSITGWMFAVFAAFILLTLIYAVVTVDIPYVTDMFATTHEPPAAEGDR